MPNGHGVQKQTYVDADDKTFRALTYDILDALNNNVCTKYSSLDDRVEKLEKRKKRDTGISAAAGLVGGFLAVVAKKIIGQ